MRGAGRGHLRLTRGRGNLIEVHILTIQARGHVARLFAPLELLVEGAMVELLKYNGNPIGLELPTFVELAVASTEPGVRGDSSSGSVTKPATLETGLEIRVPLFIKEGEKVKVSTETRSFAGRA